MDATGSGNHSRLQKAGIFGSVNGQRAVSGKTRNSEVQTSTCELLSQGEEGFSMSSSPPDGGWQVAPPKTLSKRGRARTPVWRMVMVAPALAGSTVTPRNNREKSGESEQKAVLV